MRLVLSFTILLLVAVIIYQWKYEEYDFSGTRWHCSETQMGFTSKAYGNYDKIEELTTIYFPTNGSALYYQSGTLTHKNGDIEPFELVVTSKNKIVANRIEQTFTSVDWSEKPLNSPLFIRDKNSAVGYESELNYYIDGKKLYFFSKSGSEEDNYACHKV